MSDQTSEILRRDYEYARSLYALQEASFIGRLAIGLDDCNGPINLSQVYERVNETLEEDAFSTKSWASTFGPLSINVDLTGRPTSFDLVPAKSYAPKGVSEIATSPVNRLGNIFNAADNDGSFAYLLVDNGEPSSIEMALVQALHMVDTAIVTNQYSDQAPLIRLIAPEDLMDLKAEYPDVFIRQYGNVRNLSNVPHILGSVVSVEVLEKSNIPTRVLNCVSNDSSSDLVSSLPIEFNSGNYPNKDQSAFVGITTAKLPHLGHGFLIVKAMAENMPVVIELNDQGPRVELAIARLADQRAITVDEAASLVSNGDIDILELQSAYKSRSEVEASIEVPDFKLTAPNAYYRYLIESISPPNLGLSTIANSELSSHISLLRQNPAYRSLFGEGGMGIILGENDPAVVVETKSKLTAAGILAALATTQNLVLVDSPPIVSSRDRRVFSKVGLEMSQGAGSGILIDGQVSSGTNGGTVLLQDLLGRLNTMGINSDLLLPTIRLMMDSTYCLPGEEGSICPNFASAEAVSEAFDRAVDKLQTMNDPFSVLTKPITHKNMSKSLLRSTVDDIYSQVPDKGRITAEEVKLLVNRFSLLGSRLSQNLLNYVLTPDSQTIPKNLLSDQDRATLTMFRSGSPQPFSLFLADQMEADQVFSGELLSTSELGIALQSMGYNVQSSPSILRIISKAKGLYSNDSSRQMSIL
jgi:hypothetical protein